MMTPLSYVSAKSLKMLFCFLSVTNRIKRLTPKFVNHADDLKAGLNRLQHFIYGCKSPPLKKMNKDRNKSFKGNTVVVSKKNK